MFKLSGSGNNIAGLEKYVPQTGWLELSKLTISSNTKEEYLILTAQTEAGQEMPEALAEKMLSLLPAEVIGNRLTPSPPAEALAAQRETRVKEIFAEIEKRDTEIYEKEANKLEEWADDMKVGLEREIKNLDSEIKETRRNLRTKDTLAEKIAAQRQIKELESKRNDKRRNLFDAQDDIERRRDKLIKEIEVKVNRFSQKLHRSGRCGGY